MGKEMGEGVAVSEESLLNILSVENYVIPQLFTK